MISSSFGGSGSPFSQTQNGSDPRKQLRLRFTDKIPPLPAELAAHARLKATTMLSGQVLHFSQLQP